MGQAPHIMAFRKRVKSWGYRDISISRDWVEEHERGNSGPLYRVEAVEPLAGVRVRRTYDVGQMYRAFRRGMK